MKKAKFFLSLRKFKQGYSIILNYYFDVNNRKIISSKIFISNQEHWDYKNQQVKTVCPDSYNINKTLTKLSSKANIIINEAFQKDQIYKPDKFFKILFNEKDENSVYEFILRETENYKGKFAPGTLRHYKSQRNKLIDFKAELLFNEIDISFIKRYENHLLNKRNNNRNTASKSLTFLKHIINKARAEGIVNENPFINFHISKQDGNRESLNQNELNILIETYNKNTLCKSQQKSLKIFLFACYTGIRIGDILKLKYKNIEEHKNQDGTITKLIVFNQGKTGKQNFPIPIIKDEILTMINEPDHLPDEKIFSYYKNGQTVNKHLKDIKNELKISKSLHCHIGRHTYATTVLLNNGIDVNTVSKLLGHTEIKTTQIYAKLSENFMLNEMNQLKGLV